MNRISPILKTAFRQVTKVFDCSQPLINGTNRREQHVLSEQSGGGSQVMRRSFSLDRSPSVDRLPTASVRDESFGLNINNTDGLTQSPASFAQQTQALPSELQVIKKIKNLPENWSNNKIERFFDIISRNYPNITNELSEEEIARLTERLNRPSKERPIVVMAVKKGHADAIRLLKELGANVNTPNNNGATPLHMAAERGHVEVLCTLIDCKADVNIQDNNEMTPILLAVEKSEPDVIRILAKKARVDI